MSNKLAVGVNPPPPKLPLSRGSNCHQIGVACKLPNRQRGQAVPITQICTVQRLAPELLAAWKWLATQGSMCQEARRDVGQWEQEKPDLGWIGMSMI